MIACAYGSLWLMLVLLRTGRLRWAVPYALAALLLVASHPFGLFALASELVLLAGLGGYEIATRRRHDRRGDRGARRRARARRRGAPLAPPPLLAAPVQVRRGERRRGRRPDVAVVLERPRLARHRVVRAGVLVPRGRGRRARDRLARVPRPPGRDRRRGVARAAAAPAPDPHGVIRRLRPRAPPVVPAARVLDRARRVRARARPPARAAPASSRSSSSRRCSRRSSCRAGTTSRTSTPICATRASGWRREFGPHDVLLTTGGRSSARSRTRACSAPTPCWTRRSDTPLAAWKTVDAASRCGLIRRLGQRQYPQRVWLIASTKHPLDVAAALDDAGATTSIYGNSGRGSHRAALHADERAPSTSARASGARSPSAIRACATSAAWRACTGSPRTSTRRSSARKAT